MLKHIWSPMSKQEIMEAIARKWEAVFDAFSENPTEENKIRYETMKEILAEVTIYEYN